MIVPSTRAAGAVGKFTLSLYFDCGLNEVSKIKRLDKKESKFIIQEEESGIEFEDWKLELIEKRLRFMIGTIDEDINENNLRST